MVCKWRGGHLDPDQSESDVFLSPPCSSGLLFSFYPLYLVSQQNNQVPFCILCVSHFASPKVQASLTEAERLGELSQGVGVEQNWSNPLPSPLLPALGKRNAWSGQVVIFSLLWAGEMDLEQQFCMSLTWCHLKKQAACEVQRLGGRGGRQSTGSREGSEEAHEERNGGEGGPWCGLGH